MRGKQLHCIKVLKLQAFNLFPIFTIMVSL